MSGGAIAVFDLGIVLVEPVGLYERLAELLGVSHQQLAEVYYIHRRPYDTGLPDRDYWSRTLAELGLRPTGPVIGSVDADGAAPGGLTPTVGFDKVAAAPRRGAGGLPGSPGGLDLDALLPCLVATDVAGWSTIRPEARSLLAHLGRAGVPVAVLSNAPSALAAAAVGFDWAELVSWWFFSAVLGLTKPDPALYAHVEKALAATPDQLWFVDDRAENVEAAGSRGWHAHRWRSTAETGRWLADSGLLPAFVGDDAGS